MRVSEKAVQKSKFVASNKKQLDVKKKMTFALFEPVSLIGHYSTKKIILFNYRRALVSADQLIRSTSTTSSLLLSFSMPETNKSVRK